MVNGQVVEKHISDWDEHDKKSFSLNARTLKMLYFGLNAEESNRIDS